MINKPKIAPIEVTAKATDHVFIMLCFIGPRYESWDLDVPDNVPQAKLKVRISCEAVLSPDQVLIVCSNRFPHMFKDNQAQSRVIFQPYLNSYQQKANPRRAIP
jgi:hypothetical protein